MQCKLKIWMFSSMREENLFWLLESFAIGLSGWDNLISTYVEETVISQCHTIVKGTNILKTFPK